MPQKLEISTRSILYFLGIIIGGWLLLQIRDVLFLLFIAFILMAALRPLVDSIDRLRWPRILSVLLVYVLLIGLLVGFGSLIFPPLISETTKFINNVPSLFQDVVARFNLNADNSLSQIAPLGQNVARITLSIFSNIISIFTIGILTFYLLLERRNLRQLLNTFIGEETADTVRVTVREIEERLGAWVRGELVLMLIIGMATYLGLTILGMPYALPLALIAGLLEVIPILGPIISGVPSVLVALTISPGLALAVVALYIIVQQLENNLVVPMVLRKAVGLPPLASLIALMIGGRLAGTIGIILAVPILLVIQTLVQETFLKPQKT